MHKRKSAPLVGFKSLISEGPGVFEAVVSVFGNVDYAGDRVLPGAFAASLAKWRESGDPIPVIFSHQWDNLDAHVGEVLEAKELLPGAPELAGTSIADAGGLWVKARMDVDEDFAGRLWKRLETRRIKEFSFAYDVIEERVSTDGANDLVELDVIEVGPTLKGMNPATELLLAKSLAARFLEVKSDDVDELEKMIRSELAKAGSTDPVETADLHRTLSRDTGTKAVVDLAGSVEERQGRLIAAGFDLIDLDQANGGFYDLALEGTFDDRVVFRLEGWADPMGGGRYFECAITSESSEELVLAEPVEVVVEGVTRPKARRSTKARVDVVTLEADGGRSSKSDDKVSETEDPKTRTGSESTTGEVSRLRLELDALELT